MLFLRTALLVLPVQQQQQRHSVLHYCVIPVNLANSSWHWVPRRRWRMLETTLSMVGHIKVCHACKCHCLLLKPSCSKARVALQQDGFFGSVFCLSAELWSLFTPHLDPSGEQIYFQWLTLSLPGGQQEVEGALPVHSRLVQHPLLRQQSGERKEKTTVPLRFEFNI